MAAPKHFLTMLDFTANEIQHVLKSAQALKKVPLAQQQTLLAGRTMGMIFEKPSLRTHLSFETGFYQMGGHASYMGSNQIGPLDGSREPVMDISNVMTRMVDVVVARVFERSAVYEFAEHAHCPVINALCNMEHPCQVMADFLTIIEHKRAKPDFSGSLKGLKLCFVGDGNNNVTHSLALGCAQMGMDFSVASPATAMMSQEMSQACHKIAAETGSTIVETNVAVEAVENADVVYCDTFVSMGDESRKAEILKQFEGMQVTTELMKSASPEALFMHDMPAYRGIEVTADVIDGPNSVIYDQAENRQHAQKAIVLHLMGVDVPGI